ASAYRRPARNQPIERRADPPTRSAEGPLQIVVSIGSQRLFVYDRAGLLESSTISTGVGGYPTPTGVFSVLDKEWQHYSNIYGGGFVPVFQPAPTFGGGLPFPLGGRPPPPPGGIPPPPPPSLPTLSLPPPHRCAPPAR